MKKKLLLAISSRSSLILPVFRWLGTLVRMFIRPTGARILVIRPGGLGDLVMATLSLGRYEEFGEILWMIEKRSEPWAQFLGLSYVCYDRPRDLGRLLAFRYDLLINTEQYHRLSQLPVEFLRTKKSRVLGFDTHQAANLFTDRVAYDHDYGREDLEFEKLWSLVSQRKRTAEQKISTADGLPVVALGGGDSPVRSLSLEQWKNFVELHLHESSFHLVFGPAEKKLAEQIAQIFVNQTQFVERSFAESCRLISESSLFFGIDGGLVHVASFFNRPSVVLFTNGNYRKWAPLHPKSQIVRRTDLACQPCTRFGITPPCRIDFSCKNIKGLN